MMLMTGSACLQPLSPSPRPRPTRRNSMRLRVECQRPPRRQVTPLGRPTSSRTSSTARPAPPRCVEVGGGASPRGHGRPTYWELPGNVGQYRDDRRNVFLDGKSNLVLRAAKDGSTYYSGKLFGKWRGGIGHTWQARMKLNCLTPGCWPAWYMANNSPVNGGEVDVMEWYGNGHWAAGTAVHAKLNGGEHVSQGITVDSGWHTWRVQWDDAGYALLEGLRRRRATVLRRAGELATGLAVQRARLSDVSDLGLAVAGSGGGDPGPGYLSGGHARRLGTRLVDLPRLRAGRSDWVKPASGRSQSEGPIPGWRRLLRAAAHPG